MLAPPQTISLDEPAAASDNEIVLCVLGGLKNQPNDLSSNWRLRAHRFLLRYIYNIANGYMEVKGIRSNFPPFSHGVGDAA
jgi:hypothetical protein